MKPLMSRVMGIRAAGARWDDEVVRPGSGLDGLGLPSPAGFHRVEVFGSLHRASHERARDLLAPMGLHPVRALEGQAVVFVTAVRHAAFSVRREDGTAATVPPHAHVAIGLVVTRDPVPRGLPRLRPFRGFLLAMPVTLATVRDAGRARFGLPRFVADIDFEEAPVRRRVRVSDGGADILTLTVHPRGPVTTDGTPILTYSALGGRLIETETTVLGHRRANFGPGSGELVLGDHPVAQRLRDLSVSPQPIRTMSYLDARLDVPSGRPVGPAGDYEGYAGADRPWGRWTVEYPGTGPVDQYARLGQAPDRSLETGPDPTRPEPLDDARA